MDQQLGSLLKQLNILYWGKCATLRKVRAFKDKVIILIKISIVQVWIRNVRSMLEQSVPGFLSLPSSDLHSALFSSLSYTPLAITGSMQSKS